MRIITQVLKTNSMVSSVFFMCLLHTVKKHAFLTPLHNTYTHHTPQVLKTNSLVSSVFFMCLPDKVLVYGDCAVNVSPSSQVGLTGV